MNTADSLPAFILDVHLGKLARLLRMLGFDALYRNDYKDSEIAYLAVQQQRILLTRDRELWQKTPKHLACFISGTDPLRQLQEVLTRYNLVNRIEPFHRCLNCNAPLQPVDKQTILHRLEPKTKRYYHEFYQCSQCGKIYWKGSHYDRMKAFIARLTEGMDEHSQPPGQ